MLTAISNIYYSKHSLEEKVVLPLLESVRDELASKLEDMEKDLFLAMIEGQTSPTQGWSENVANAMHTPHEDIPTNVVIAMLHYSNAVLEHLNSN